MTPAPDVEAHAAAVLQALLASGLTVFDGHVPTGEARPALPYAVLWMAAPLHRTSTLAGHQQQATVAWTTHSVGQRPENARWVQSRVHSALVDARLTVPGRAVSKVKHDVTQPVRADRDVDPAVFSAVDQWSLLSLPAPA